MVLTEAVQELAGAAEREGPCASASANVKFMGLWGGDLSSVGFMVLT